MDIALFTILSTVLLLILFQIFVHYYRKGYKELKELNTKRRNLAFQKEKALNYSEAAKIWEELGEIKEAARVRKMQAELGSVKVAQKVVQGDEVTEIKDSVLNRSNVGGGSSKMQELKELKEMRNSGDISDEDYEKMKREIIG